MSHRVVAAPAFGSNTPMRAAVARSSLLGLALLVVSLVIPTTARAENSLANGTASPESGSTETDFAFTVEYTSERLDPPAVYADVAGIRVSMTLVSGLPSSGTYAGSARLPVGEWQVVFRAEALQGPDPELPGPIVRVADANPTPPPTARPTPTPTPTPRPTPTPTPTPVPTPTPTPTPSPTPEETPGGGVFSPSPTPTETSSPSPTATAEPEPESSNGSGIGFVPLAMLFIGGTAAGAGAALLTVTWIVRRTTRPAHP